MSLTRFIWSLISLCLFSFQSLSQSVIVEHPSSNEQLLHSVKSPANIVFDSIEPSVVHIAAKSLQNDFLRVSQKQPTLQSTVTQSNTSIYIATLGYSDLLNTSKHPLNNELETLQGKWESFIISALPDPTFPDRLALFVIGSDPRGTAYGVFEVSKIIGVSPWHWWADITPQKKNALYIAEQTQYFGPPSVKYRGIFINDEDWGLFPWAAQHFDPVLANIGPKTYEKIFDLLLRLKANTLWPAMHKVSLAFNEVPQNKVLAQQYSILMGSSHAEPMLRNNVKEWRLPKSEYNFLSHPNKVTEYWRERLIQNGQYDNIYTLGMRGIHDSGIQGGTNEDQQIALLENIITTQRDLLSQHVSSELELIPQVFTPYKEVLNLYRNGLSVPEDVMLIWPDDNHGYIRQLPNSEERQRSGGSGVYYHLSYLGAPMAYLWLATTPPAVVWQEMNKAYALGAQAIWIANVGDIKPAELSISHFMEMAWNIDTWNHNTQHEFIGNWLERQFGSQGKALSELVETYFALNYQRRPEHLQWYLPHQKYKSSNLSGQQIKHRLAQFEALSAKAISVKSSIPATLTDAFFQLIEYPILASASANQLFFHTEQYDRWFHQDITMARKHGKLAQRAKSKLEALTSQYNEKTSGGKWQGIMAVEPADNLWRSYRQNPIVVPAPTLNSEAEEIPDLAFLGKEMEGVVTVIPAEHFVNKKPGNNEANVQWYIARELGRFDDAVALYPFVEMNIESEKIKHEAPYIDYPMTLNKDGNYYITFSLMPSFPMPNNNALHLAFSVPTAKDIVRTLSLKRASKSTAWHNDVLSAHTRMQTMMYLPKGKHILRVYGIDTAIAIDNIIVSETLLADSFLVPE